MWRTARVQWYSQRETTQQVYCHEEEPLSISQKQPCDVTCLSRVHLAFATSAVPQRAFGGVWRAFVQQLSSLLCLFGGEADSVFSVETAASIESINSVLNNSQYLYKDWRKLLLVFTNKSRFNTKSTQKRITWCIHHGHVLFPYTSFCSRHFDRWSKESNWVRRSAGCALDLRLIVLV